MLFRSVEPKNASAFIRLTDALEEHDDVQNVYTNADLSDEAMAASEK